MSVKLLCLENLVLYVASGPSHSLCDNHLVSHLHCLLDIRTISRTGKCENVKETTEICISPKHSQEREDCFEQPAPTLGGSVQQVVHM